jgi:integrase/recombinase XerD
MPPRRRRKPRPPARVIGNPADPVGMAARLNAYLEWMLVRNFSTSTVELRRYNIAIFIGWCEQRGLTRPVEITKPIIERYQRWMYHYRSLRTGKPLGFRAQGQRLSHVRAFFRWMTRQNLLLHNPASEIELPRREKRLPGNVLTEAEAARVLDQPDTTDPLGVRDRTMLEVLYSTGIRRAELRGLRLADIDPDRGVVFVSLGKGKKDRYVPIGEQALAWLERYTQEVRPQLATQLGDSTLFLTNLGEFFELNSLSALVAGYIDQAQVGKRGGCHIFRHTMATAMLDNGADVRFIQEILGHVELSTTEIYTHVAIRKLKEVHTATHPTAKLERPRAVRTASTSADPQQLCLFEALQQEAVGELADISKSEC